jgi:tight adherence protein C
MTLTLFVAAALTAAWAVVRARKVAGAESRGWARVAGAPVPGELVERLTPADAEDRLARAGVRAEPCAVGRARAVGVGGGVVLGASCALVWPPAAVLAIPAGAAGAAVPSLALRRAAASRGRRIRADLPQALDLLAICVTGGMAIDPALGALVRHTEGPLAEELRQLLRSIRTGTERRAAYEGLVERCCVEEVRALVESLEQSEELGAPLAAALLAQSKSARDSARRSALERAAGAAPKIQLVTAVVLVPAAMLLIVATLLLQLGEQVGGAVGGAP